MARNNTGNPIGSDEFLDFQDNVKNLDVAVNAQDPSWPDRFGVARKTWWGMEQDFQQFLLDSGYVNIGDYGPELEITARNQIFWRDGELYRPGAVLELPYTTTGDWATEEELFVAVGDNSLRQELSMPSGSSLVGFQRDEVGSIPRRLDSRGNEYLSVFDFGVEYSESEPQDVAMAAAIDAAVDTGLELRIPYRGTILLRPSIEEQDEAGPNVAALLLRSGLHIRGYGATLKIADGVSTDESPLRHSMFFSNSVLNDIQISGLTLDMNGQNNPISPGRPSDYNRFTNAQICISGTPGGIAGRASNVKISNCKFINNAGVSCIVAGQSNTVGAAIGDNWEIENCDFRNVGLDTDDHSCIFGWTTNFRVLNCRFVNPSPWNLETKLGGLCAIELHASNSRVDGCEVINFYQAVWVSMNFTESITRGIIISDNNFEISSVGIAFWSDNMDWAGGADSLLDQINIHGNTMVMTDADTDVALRAFIQFNAGRQPQRVSFNNNVCRSFSTTKDTVGALVVVTDRQREQVNQACISNNIFAGITTGLVTFFDGDGDSPNVGSISWLDNDVGILVSGSVLPSVDIYLYGPSDGRISELHVSGLSHPSNPIVVDSNEEGRAYVHGQAVFTGMSVIGGITYGDGAFNSKISLDTDAGIAHLNARFSKGSTSIATSNIFILTPIFADADYILNAWAQYSSGGSSLTAIGGSTSQTATVNGPNGPMTSSYPQDFTNLQTLTISGPIPCRRISV